MSDGDDSQTSVTGSLVPVVASVDDGCKWKPVVIHRDALAITGGLQCKGPQTAPCIHYTMGGTIWPFVELDKNARWFLNTVGGSVTNKGDLKTVNVLSEIRAAFHGPLADSDSNTAAVADDDSAVAEDSQDKGEIDPMDALVEVRSQC